MKTALCAIVLAMAVEGACASAPLARSFSDLPKYLSRGGTIYLTETTGPTTTGRLEHLSATGLAIMADGRRRDVSESRVRQIQRPKRWIGRGALIGLGAGLVVGGLTIRDSSNPLDRIVFGIGVGAMTGLGALTGAIVKTRQTVYLAPTPQDPAR